MVITKLRLGTRKSPLALKQSDWVKAQIVKKYPLLEVKIIKIKTYGDKLPDKPLREFSKNDMFIKEIEEALLKEEIDIGVHSMKDVPSELPDALHIGIVTRRENPHDAFLSNSAASLAELPAKARIGTSSLRRKAQLAKLRPDLVIEDLRGNLDTRLRKLDEGRYDAIILAAAGLNRLGLAKRATAYFSAVEMLPAVAQGAVGIELRKNDTELLAGLTFLDDRDTALAVTAERGFLRRLEGGCQVPIAGFAELKDGLLVLTGLVASVDGTRLIKKSVTGPSSGAEALGVTLAEELLALGAKEILAEVYGREMA